MAFTRVQGSGLYQSDGVTGTVTYTAGTANFTVGNLVAWLGAHYADPQSDAVTGVTFNGDAGTARVSRANPTNFVNQALIYDRTAMATGGAHSTAVTLSGAGSGGGGHFMSSATCEYSFTGTLSVVGTSTADGSTTTATVNTPAGTAVGDLIIAALVIADGGTRTITQPTGFTSEYNEGDSNSHEGGAGVSRISVSSGAFAVSWTLSVAAQWSAVVAVYNSTGVGASGSDPIEGAGYRQLRFNPIYRM